MPLRIVEKPWIPQYLQARFAVESLQNGVWCHEYALGSEAEARVYMKALAEGPRVIALYHPAVETSASPADEKSPEA